MSPLMGRTPVSDMHKLAVERVWGSREAKERLRMRGAWRGSPHLEWECPRCHRWGFAKADAKFFRCYFDDALLKITRRAE